ncbi:unnamed protein product [Sympodiomycopsis kandeliae]
MTGDSASSNPDTLLHEDVDRRTYLLAHMKSPFHAKAADEIALNAYSKGELLTLSGQTYVIVDRLRPAGDASTYLVIPEHAQTSCADPKRVVLKVFDPKTTLHRAPATCFLQVTGQIIPWTSEVEAAAQKWLTGSQAHQFRHWLQDHMDMWWWLKAHEQELLESDDPEDKEDYHSRFSDLMDELRTKPWGAGARDGQECLEAHLQDDCELRFRRELFAYRRLEQYQGTRIPKVLQHGQVEYQNAPDRFYKPWALLLEYVEDAAPLSDLLGPLDHRGLPLVKPQHKLTNELKQSLEQATRDIVDWFAVFGVLHNDLEVDNFLVADGGTRIVIVDFSEALVAGIPPRSYDAAGTFLPMEGDLFPQELNDDLTSDEITPADLQHPKIYRTGNALLKYRYVHDSTDLLEDWTYWINCLRDLPRGRVCSQDAEYDRMQEFRCYTFSEQMQVACSTKDRTKLRKKMKKVRRRLEKVRRKFTFRSRAIYYLFWQIEAVEEDKLLRTRYRQESIAAREALQDGKQLSIGPMLEASKTLPPSIPLAARKLVYALAEKAHRDEQRSLQYAQISLRSQSTVPQQDAVTASASSSRSTSSHQTESGTVTAASHETSNISTSSSWSRVSSDSHTSSPPPKYRATPPTSSQSSRVPSGQTSNSPPPQYQLNFASLYGLSEDNTAQSSNSLASCPPTAASPSSRVSHTQDLVVTKAPLEDDATQADDLIALKILSEHSCPLSQRTEGSTVVQPITTDEFLRIDDMPTNREWEVACWEMHDEAGIWASLNISRQVQRQWLTDLPTHPSFDAAWVWEDYDPDDVGRVNQWRPYNALLLTNMRMHDIRLHPPAEEAFLTRLACFERERVGGTRVTTFR